MEVEQSAEDSGSEDSRPEILRPELPPSSKRRRDASEPSEAGDVLRPERKRRRAHSHGSSSRGGHNKISANDRARALNAELPSEVAEVLGDVWKAAPGGGASEQAIAAPPNAGRKTGV